MTDSKKAKRLSKKEIKKELLHSMIIDENLEFDDLNKKKLKKYKFLKRSRDN